MGRPLLYFTNRYIKTLYWNGNPVCYYTFQDISTGNEVILAECFVNEEISKYKKDYRYYRKITDAVADYDILWYASYEGIRTLSTPLEEIESEYRRMQNDGVSKFEVNYEIMKDYEEYKGRKYKRR